MQGFIKKVFIADSIAPLADSAFALSDPSTADAWLGILAYTAQLYFDFSGYSDMAIGLGLVITIAVQSSSITTSILVPMAAAGVLTIQNIYPVTLGANVGTTITALLAALAASSPDALTIALVHTTFNVVGILILYGIPPLRNIPIRLAEGLAGLAVVRKAWALAYVVGTFIIVPLVGIALLR